MSIVYYRPEACGLCSHLASLCICLNRDRPDKVGIDISLANYKCNWNDIFNVESIEGTRHYLITDWQLIIKYNNKSDYDIEIIKEWNECWNKYIHPNEEVMEKIKLLCDRYPISESTCLYFRGLDKNKETPRINFDLYLTHIPKDGPIYVQSDEASFISYIKERYPDRAYSIEEFYHNVDSVPIHFTNRTSINDAIEILSIAYLMAKSKKIVANISNVTQVALIIRGNNEGYICVQ